MRNELFLTVWIIAFPTLFDITDGEPCRFSYPCACSSHDFIVDLYPLMYERREPFYAPDKQKDTKYYLNPCGEHLTISSCSQLGGGTAAGCQIQDNVAYGIAKTTGYTAAGDPNNGTVHFTYSFKGADGTTRTTILAVKCSSNEDEFTFLGELTKAHYTRFACGSSSSSHGLSVGSVLLIIFFVSLAIYFIGGCLFQNFVRNAQGFEKIPNYEFWRDLPVLIKDGMIFTISKFKGSSTYEKI